MTDNQQFPPLVTPELRLARAVKHDLEEESLAEGGAANFLDDIAAMPTEQLARHLAAAGITTVQGALDFLTSDGPWRVGDVVQDEHHPLYGRVTAAVTEMVTPLMARVRILDGPSRDHETTVPTQGAWTKLGTGAQPSGEEPEPQEYRVSTHELLTLTAEGYGWKVASDLPTELEFHRIGRSAGEEWVHCLFAAGGDTLTGVTHSDTLTPDHHWSATLAYTCREWALVYLVR